MKKKKGKRWCGAECDFVGEIKPTNREVFLSTLVLVEARFRLGLWILLKWLLFTPFSFVPAMLVGMLGATWW